MELDKSQLYNRNFFKKEVNIDNTLLEALFSTDDALSHKLDKEEIKFEDHIKIDEINFIIENMLPEIEKRIVFLIYYMKKKQEVVGRILNISQEMVCYYKKRALIRIRLHNFFRKIDIKGMEEFLDKYVTRKQKIAMLEYFKEHDLRKITKTISLIEEKGKCLSYISIGKRISLGIKKLEKIKDSDAFDAELKEKAVVYHEIFMILKKHNSLYHTQSKKEVTNELEAG